MNRATLIGGVLSLAGLVGYAVGVSVAYPGRAFSITALITGIALLTIFREPGGVES
jgi:hypothetical protein